MSGSERPAGRQSKVSVAFLLATLSERGVFVAVCLSGTSRLLHQYCVPGTMLESGTRVDDVVLSLKFRVRIKMWHPVSWNLATQKSV